MPSKVERWNVEITLDVDMLSLEENCWEIYVNLHPCYNPISRYNHTCILGITSKDIYVNLVGWKNLLRPFTFSSSFISNVKKLSKFSTIGDQARDYKLACAGSSLSAIVSQL